MIGTMKPLAVSTVRYHDDWPWRWYCRLCDAWTARYDCQPCALYYAQEHLRSAHPEWKPADSKDNQR